MIRELRHAIAHEYEEEALISIHREVLRLTPLLLKDRGVSSAWPVKVNTIPPVLPPHHQKPKSPKCLLTLRAMCFMALPGGFEPPTCPLGGDEKAIYRH